MTIDMINAAIFAFPRAARAISAMDVMQYRGMPLVIPPQNRNRRGKRKQLSIQHMNR
jgi:hypothetical protein